MLVKDLKLSRDSYKKLRDAREEFFAMHGIEKEGVFGIIGDVRCSSGDVIVKFLTQAEFKKFRRFYTRTKLFKCAADAKTTPS